MIGRLFTVASVLSLLLCIGVVPLWLRSYWRHDYAGVRVRSSLVAVQSNMGHVALVRITAHAGEPRRNWQLVRGSETASFNFIWDTSGGEQFSHGREEFLSPRGRTVLECWTTPYWLWAVLTFILPAAMVIRRRAHPHDDPQRCRRCGYDLRASADRCPECGTPIITDAGPKA